MNNVNVVCPLLYWTVLIAGCRFELRHGRQKPHRPCPLLQKEQS